MQAPSEDAVPAFKKKKARGRGSAGAQRSLSATNVVDSEHDGNTAVVRNKKQGVASKLKERERGKSRLSFSAEDDGADDASSDASTPSRRLMRPVPSTSGSVSNQSALSSTASYSSEALLELKSLTPSTAKSAPAPDAYDSLTKVKFGALALNPSDADVSASTNIPTEAAISAARQRRTLARKTGIDPSQVSVVEDDFISLSDSTAIVNHGANKSGESRLVREEDELGEGDDEHAEFTGATERVALGRKAGLASAKKRREGIIDMIDDVEGQDDVDEEEAAWEEEQVRRAIAGGAKNDQTKETKSIYKPLPLPEVGSVPALLNVQNRLKQTLASHEEDQTSHLKVIQQASQERATFNSQEVELRQAVEKAGNKEVFFNDLRTFIEDLSVFFRAKWSTLEKIENDLQSILKERADLISTRRFQDNSDDLAFVTGTDVPLSIPNVAEAAEDTVMVDLEEVDELGRVKMTSDTSPLAITRVTRRRDRVLRRERRQAIRPSTEEDGYSTDDELLPAEAADFASATSSLSTVASQLFDDVVNAEFASPTAPGGLSDRFVAWQKTYGDEYRHAFGGLALVQTWEFWARIELASTWDVWGIREWTSLGKKGDSGLLEGWNWKSGLDHYEQQLDERVEGNSVVAAMLSSVIVTFLLPIVKTSYDPYSRTSTERSLQIIEQISYELDRKSCPTFESLILTFLTRFQTSVFELQTLVKNTSFIPPSLKKKTEGEDESRARSRVIQGSLKLLRQGLRWRSLSKGLFLSSNEEHLGGGRPLEHLLGIELIGKVIVPLLRDGKQASSVSPLALKISKMCPFGVIPQDIAEELAHL